MLFGQATEREHAILVNDKAEILFRAFFLQRIHKQLTHTVDSLAHIGQFLFPNRAQCWGAQNCGNYRGAMRWWVRVVSTDNRFNLTERNISYIVAGCNDSASPNTLVVQAEVFE